MVLPTVDLPKCANKNPARGFYRYPYYILEVLSRTHPGGSTENLFIFQGFYLEHTQVVVQRAFLNSRTLSQGSPINLFIFQGFDPDYTPGVLQGTFLYSKSFSWLYGEYFHIMAH